MNENDYLAHLANLWRKNWPADLPQQAIYPFGEILMSDYLRQWAEKTPDKACLVYYGTEMTFAELDVLSNRLASFLAERGFQKGDRVGIFLPNCPQFLIAFFGIIKIGCVVVPVNPMFRAYELLYELNDSGARAIIAQDMLYPLVQEIRDQTSLEDVLVTSLNDYLPEEPTIPVHPTLKTPKQDCPQAMDLMSILQSSSDCPPDREVTLDDVVILNYTGGTTGLPKGCEHTQRDMIYTAANAATFGSYLKSEDITLVYIPIFWIAGEDAGVLIPIFAGMTEVLLTRWDPEAVLTAIDRYRVNWTVGLVDNMVELMEHPDAGQYNLRSLKHVVVTSFVKKVNPELRRQFEEWTGAVLREGGYGLTETNTADTFTAGMQRGDMDLKTRNVFEGLPVPGTEIKIVDFDTGALVPLGQDGEIVMRTPSLMKSYWNKPEETQKVLRDGWLFTGDIGMLDTDGYLHYLGRRKEMLKIKGMSVFPSEIETFLQMHPAVDAVGVIGRPAEDKGDQAVAFVRLNPEFAEKTNESDLTDWCKKNIAPYKVPVIRIMDELPLTTTGKVAKEDLKIILQEE